MRDAEDDLPISPKSRSQKSTSVDVASERREKGMNKHASDGNLLAHTSLSSETKSSDQTCCLSTKTKSISHGILKVRKELPRSGSNGSRIPEKEGSPKKFLPSALSRPSITPHLGQQNLDNDTLTSSTEEDEPGKIVPKPTITTTTPRTNPGKRTMSPILTATKHYGQWIDQ